MPITSISEFKRQITGSGLVHPFRRLAASDFVSATGESLIKSNISQIIGTRRGEIPWMPEFGLDIEKYRHSNIVSPKEQRIADEVAGAISKWEKRCVVVSSTGEKKTDENQLRLRISWRLKPEGSSLNVRLPEISQEETI